MHMFMHVLILESCHVMHACVCVCVCGNNASYICAYYVCCMSCVLYLQDCNMWMLVNPTSIVVTHHQTIRDIDIQ